MRIETLPDIEKELKILDTRISIKAYEHMITAIAMSSLYEKHTSVTSRYVHATSRGHEAIQIALGMQLLPIDYLFPYYRDDSLLLSIGIQPYDLMLQLLARRNDPFSGGRTYYSHPSLREDGKPKIPHQSSATGMQAIPAVGAAMGMAYQERKYQSDGVGLPVSVCSLGDASVTEGEVSEALQMASLKQLPVLFLVQDNGWDISATAAEVRAMNADQYAKGFNGIEARVVDGSDFEASYLSIKEILAVMRVERRPFLLRAEVPLIGHHTSGVRREWYRNDLQIHQQKDPYPLLRKKLISQGVSEEMLEGLESDIQHKVEQAYQFALEAEEPYPSDLHRHVFAPTPITQEVGEREPSGRQPVVMVDSALIAIREIMEKHPECVFYGQDVGKRLGGVFREAATLAERFGDERIFNTPIQEAFIIGSTVGMSAVGLKPIVEVQFADYIWPGLNQLFSEVSRSCYLSNGKWPVSMILRVPTGAYGSGGPYHSSSVESVVLNIHGVKVAYPSNGADLKGLLKSAYYDPNPVVIFEHKGLYWSKIKGTEGARTIDPDENYVIPFGKARIVLQTNETNTTETTMLIVTYGMGVYWSMQAAKRFAGRIEIIDLRTLNPWDEGLVFERVKAHGRCMIVTEEVLRNSFAEAMAGSIQHACFAWLDAPVEITGAEKLPAIPLNSNLENAMLPNADRVGALIEKLLKY
ncbi:MAG: tungsten formylmethanofuran dehydrogenase [Candidatus Competibacteraceae bacterium]|nr:tungsten formylmethanofuran dehydrogenase [Candidatus Competibacteraceae bacterium]